MKNSGYLKSALLGGACAAFMAPAAQADQFNIASGDLKAALHAYIAQTGIQLIVSDEAVRGVRTPGVRGNLAADAALTHILSGTGFVAQREDSAIAVVRGSKEPEPVTRLADAAPTHAATSVETVVVTSSKIKGDIQTVPIAITALSQEQLTSRQIAGGPDLVKEVPNLTFTKTNFTGYSIAIRGIGTQAISVATDPAVAVALNDIPFIRNHFFEQEFYDVNQVEVVRGPQGTLYGRNATAGVVNVISAKPTDQFEAMLSADWGNYTNRRYEGMVNIPIDTDQVDLRVAGEWTKRDGYTINENTGSPVDGRDLWSTRVTLGWHPLQNVQSYLVWEHFSENDDRMRTQKQLCKTDDAANHPAITNVLGIPIFNPGTTSDAIGLAFSLTQGYLSQGCLPTSMYSKDAFEVPYGYALPYVEAGYITGGLNPGINPYASATQSTNLRDIQTQIDPKYIAKNDTLEFNVDYNVTPSLTFTSQTGWNEDFLWSTEDYNRFNTSEGVFRPISTSDSDVRAKTAIIPYSECRTPPAGGSANYWYFDDPQLGCSDRLVAQDVSREHAWQLSQEFRLASNFSGPFNFSFGGNYMHYETVEDYFVFANTLTLFAAVDAPNFAKGNPPPGDAPPWMPGVTDNHECFHHSGPFTRGFYTNGYGWQYSNPNNGAGTPTEVCYYLDPNNLQNLNGQGHNYFRSMNPYVLNSYAGFGEVYYNVLPDLKLIGGARWTSDHKHFIDIPSELLASGYGYLPIGVVNQAWNQWTGRFAANWTPKLDFTDQTLVYGSFSHGYKAGGANPPGATLFAYGNQSQNGVPVHPLTFKPEFIDAYELGTKNTLMDGGLTLNGDVFYYNYTGYQISKIVDRTAINDNFNATVHGAELEATYEPIPGLKFNFAGGYEHTRVDNGQASVDLMDRTAGHLGWVLMKPFVTLPSNCIFPDYVIAAMLANDASGEGDPIVSACGTAYNNHEDPVPERDSGGFYHWNDGNPYYTLPGNGGVDPGSPQYYYPFTPIHPGYPGGTYAGFDPLAGTLNDPYHGQNTFNGVDYGPVPNNGEGFAKDLSGHELPNAPHFTVSLGGEYTIPVSEDWAATLHSDFYWQSQSWSRIYNDRPYDKIRGYSNVNLALILTSASGWQVMGYLKNVFDTTAITGTFLNSDDSGLTTNVFLTDPRLFGVRVTKNW